MRPTARLLDHLKAKLSYHHLQEGKVFTVTGIQRQRQHSDLPLTLFQEIFIKAEGGRGFKFHIISLKDKPGGGF